MYSNSSLILVYHPYPTHPHTTTPHYTTPHYTTLHCTTPHIGLRSYTMCSLIPLYQASEWVAALLPLSLSPCPSHIWCSLASSGWSQRLVWCAVLCCLLHRWLCFFFMSYSLLLPVHIFTLISLSRPTHLSLSLSVHFSTSSLFSIYFQVWIRRQGLPRCSAPLRKPWWVFSSSLKLTQSPWQSCVGARTLRSYIYTSYFNFLFTCLLAYWPTYKVTHLFTYLVLTSSLLHHLSHKPSPLTSSTHTHTLTLITYSSSFRLSAFHLLKQPSDTGPI